MSENAKLELRDVFPPARVRQKEIKNSRGEVVAKVDYIGWSQAADRLDEAEPGWSFEIRALGTDWCHGRLTMADGRYYENIGYAEHADAAWKVEPLKDAVSDALKRCAALAGVGRYLYDQDHPTGRGASPSRPSAAPAGRSQARPAGPPPTANDAPDEEGLLPFPPIAIAKPGDLCEMHGVEWRGEVGDMFHRVDNGGWHRHEGNTVRRRS